MDKPDPTANATNSLLAAIVDSSDDAIVSKTLEGIITSWNRGAMEIFGYTVEEAVGKHITLIIPSDRLSEEEEVLRRLRRGEKIDHFETERVTKSGKTVNISLTVSPIKDDHGKIIGASKVARDITQRKQAEAELTRLAALEKAARQTAEEARRGAEEANRIKDDFLATVSHELRNPLNSIVGWAGLLNTRKFDETTVIRAVQAILRASQAQDQIIGDLLDVSRIISGRMRLDVRPLILNEVLENAIETLRPAAEAKRIRFETILDPAAGPQAGDPDRLRQVFWNLISNAVKFTPNAGRIQVVSERIDSHIEVSVSDTGAGIDPKFLPYVFDRFRQGDAGTNRNSTGLGLGLSIVRHLVELHGGSVRAESPGIGLGSCFTVLLPTLIAPTRQDDGRHPSAETFTAAEAGTAPSLKDLRILLIDDEAGAREVASAILTQAEAEVKSAASALEALATLNEWLPDVLVVDIGMPDIDGYEFIRRLRARSPENGGTRPAAALTAYARTQDRMRVLSEGFQMHVPKPIQPAELVTVVASLAKRLA
jgi:PAS domain S-box-containing protein